MINYRRRYLTSKEFSSYCTVLNLELASFEHELELYERDGVLLPVARIIQPDEYVIKRYQLDRNSESYGEKIPEWNDLEMLIYRPKKSGYPAESILWHFFDWEFEQKNSFLSRPTSEKFKPWKDYRVQVEHGAEGELFRNTTTHYYHYYQVHQVHAIQNKYPVYAKQNWLLKNVKDEVKELVIYLRPAKDDQIASLYGQAICFDALSFFVELYERELRRTFDAIDEDNGVKTLNDQQYAQYKKQLIKHAKFVLRKFGLVDEDLYKFLFYLLDLHSEYERKEYVKLANELLLDIQALVKFISNAMNLSVGDIEREVGQRNKSVWLKQKFRHLDNATKIYDYTQDTFERLRSNYNIKFVNFNITQADIEKLIDFIEKHGLFILPYAIHDIDETINDGRVFRTTSLYIGLSNFTTGFECYLREIANKANQSQNLSIETKDLNVLIRTMFQKWGKLFANEHQQRQEQSTFKNDPFLYLTDVYTAPNLDEIVRTFLIAYRSRNFVAHNYTFEQELYYNWYSIIYTAICDAILYSWVHAANNSWV